MSQRYRHTQQVVERKIRGEHILVPLMKSEEQLDALYTLNPTASQVWELAGRGQSAAEIARFLTDQYAVDFAVAEADVRRIIADLLAIRALEPLPS